MEYQQFVVYCHWTNYQSPHHSRRRNGDDESLRRGLRERARQDRIANRQAWRAALERVAAALLPNRRSPRVAA
jgi:hypothetical protein